MKKDSKTIIAFKLRGGRTASEVWMLVKILLAFALLLGVLGAAKLGVCKYDRPEWSVKRCLFPGLGK